MTRSLSTLAATGDGLDPEVREPAGSAADGGDALDRDVWEPVGPAARVGSAAGGPGTRPALMQAGRLSSRPVRVTSVVRTLPRAALVSVVVKDGFFQRCRVQRFGAGQVKGRLNLRECSAHFTRDP
jgi:hypothetical protein